MLCPCCGHVLDVLVLEMSMKISCPECGFDDELMDEDEEVFR